MDYPQKAAMKYRKHFACKVDEETDDLIQFAKDHGYDAPENSRIALKAWFKKLKNDIESKTNKAS